MAQWSGTNIVDMMKPWMMWAERASEYKLTAFMLRLQKNFLNLVQTTLPYEHEYNGTAEVLNCIILEMLKLFLMNLGC